MSITIATKWFVEFLHPGAFYPEESCIEIASPDAKFEIPESAYAYTVYSIETKTTVVDNEQFKKTKRTDIPGRVYIGGQILNLADIPDTGDYSILRSNMLSNHWKHLILCRTGNYQPFTVEDRQVFP